MSLKLNERYPGRFSNPSADYPAGSFKNRTTPDSKDGSYLEKDWANDKEGFFQSLLFSAGIAANGAVDKVGASQFFDALQKLKQAQAGVSFNTTGTATAQILTPTPAIASYTTAQRFNVTFNVASGLNPTINISSLGAKSLKQYNASGAKVAAAFFAGFNSDIVYDGTDWIILDQLPSNSTDGGLVGSAAKLRITTDGTTGIAVVSASSVFLGNGSGRGTYESISSSVSIALSGLGGLDTGSPAASTFYYVWLVQISGVSSLVLSLSNAAPSPATVPASALVCRLGTVRTGSVATVLRPGLQRNKKYQYDPKPATNFTSLVSLASVSGPISSTAVTISTEVPPTAVAVEISLSGSASGASMAASATPRAASGFGVGLALPSGASNSQKGGFVLAEPVIYWAVAFTGGGSASLSIAGWDEE